MPTRKILSFGVILSANAVYFYKMFLDHISAMSLKLRKAKFVKECTCTIQKTELFYLVTHVSCSTTGVWTMVLGYKWYHRHLEQCWSNFPWLVLPPWPELRYLCAMGGWILYCKFHNILFQSSLLECSWCTNVAQYNHQRIRLSCNLVRWLLTETIEIVWGKSREHQQLNLASIYS